MDYKKVNGEYHFVCPSCKKEIEINGLSVKTKLLNLKTQLADTDRRLGSLKDIPPEQVDPKRRYSLIKKKEKLLADLEKAKADVHLVSQCTEVEKLKKFTQLAREALGDQKYIELMEQAKQNVIEDQIYTYKDLMKQRYTNFQGA